MNFLNYKLDNDYFHDSSSDEYVGTCGDVTTESISDCLSLDGQIFLFKCSTFKKEDFEAQSIVAHFTDNMIASFSIGVVDAILVSESWLKPLLPTSICSLYGYKLFRNDRTGFGGGGVCIFIRDSKSCTVVSKSPSECSGTLEHLFLEVTVHHTKILLEVV
ncbi:hypothetical protein ACJJTC_004771 [Scirpophaga incertulas]